MMMSVNSLLSYSGAGSCGMRSSWPRSRSRLEYVLRQAAVTRLSGGHAPPEQISSRHSSLSGLDKIRVLWRKATTRPPRPLRKAAVPTARGPECCLGGAPPPERISSWHSSLSGLDKIRVLWRKATTRPPPAAEESGRPHCVGPRVLSGGHAPPERISSRHASLSGLDKIRVLWRKATTRPPTAAGESGRPHCVGPRL